MDRRTHAFLPGPAPGRADAGLLGRAHGDAVEPARDLLPAHDRGRLPGQDQEGRLEGVLGLVRIAQDAAADAQHHRPVPLHQLGECLLGRLVPTREESLEQLLVAERPGHAELIEGPQVPVDLSATIHRA